MPPAASASNFPAAPGGDPPPGPHHRQGRLTVRPQEFAGRAGAHGALPPGLHALGISRRRDGLLYIPSKYSPDKPAPLIVTMHGAGGNAQGGIAQVVDAAEANGAVLLSPPSRGSTWDVLRGGFGPDVAFIDAALKQTLSVCNIDCAHLAVSGFSDGASYALSLGQTNGNIFTHILAFSPGFSSPAVAVGKPPVYISHGVHDQVLSIDYCSRRLVPRLRSQGYAVTYEEFNGPHTVPRAIAQQAVDWCLGRLKLPPDFCPLINEC